MASGGEAIEKFLDHLNSDELLLKLNWEEWLSITPPYQETSFSTEDATVRFQRNGYDWDMHGSVYTPEKEIADKRAFVVFPLPVPPSVRLWAFEYCIGYVTGLFLRSNP